MLHSRGVSDSESKPTESSDHNEAGEPASIRGAVVLAVLWALLPAVGGFYLLAHIGTIRDWLDTHGSMAVVIFIVGFAATAGLGLLPTYAQAVLAGWVFGLSTGAPAALMGFTGAALVGYVVARLVARDRAQHYIATKPRYQAVRDALVGQGFMRTLGIVSLIRVPPNSPFAMTNLVLAGTGTSLLPFAIGTVIGMTPRTVVAVALAASARGSRDIQEFIDEGPGFWVFFAGVVVLFIVLAIIGNIANKAIARVIENGGGQTAAADESA